MRNSPVFFGTLVAFLSFLFCNSKVFAGDIEWSGNYRIEGNQINNSEMRGSNKRELGYGLSHFVLRPKIVAGDGFTIFGQFDMFNSSTEANSQMGQVFGSGIGTGVQPATGPATSNSLSRTQKAESLEISQLYLTYNHEYGQLIAGRAPLQFGLGMTYNAGRGLFDHWYDTRDLVGYKFVVGNLYFLPMLGKPAESNVGTTDDVDDYMIQVQYENPDTDLEMGVFYRLRKGGDQASDAPVFGAGEMGGVGADNMTSINSKIVNLYALRDAPTFRAGLEASFMSGENGLRTAGGEKVTWSGFGIAGEFEYRPDASSWKWGLKAGTATGDDPATDAKFEGFTFNRNYDVAMLLFNHVLGAEDYFRTRSTLTGATRDTNGNIVRGDVEALSNVLYVAPAARYGINEKWMLENRLVAGWLGNNPIAGKTISKDIGYEWDINLTFTPRKGVQWINEFGLLLPGSMWKGSSTATDNDTKPVYGMTTKAAISF